jgi:hypothetical protein
VRVDVLVYIKRVSELIRHQLAVGEFVNSIWPTLMLSFGPPAGPTISLAPDGA